MTEDHSSIDEVDSNKNGSKSGSKGGSSTIKENVSQFFRRNKAAKVTVEASNLSNSKSTTETSSERKNETGEDVSRKLIA